MPLRSQSFVRFCFPLCLAAACVFTSDANAQTAAHINEEYDHTSKAAQTLVVLGPELFGESVNLKDGATSFSAIDVSLPTNSGLPVSIGRSLGVSTPEADGYVSPALDGELFGNWALDVPTISGVFDERTGWVSSNSASPTTRCSDVGAPPAVKSAYGLWDIYYYSEDYWRGNVIDIPGKGRYPMLGVLGGRPVPTDGKTYRWITKANWAISCIPLKNGAGEGFLVTLPDGTRYAFDWMSSRRAPALKDTHCDNTFLGYDVRGINVNHLTEEQVKDLLKHRLDGGGSISGGEAATICSTQVVVNRREYTLHATRIEDRHGNVVLYQYDPGNPRRLLSVASNDGAAIALTYGANGKINAVSAHGRQWQYQYQEVSGFGSRLTAVILPDGSRWTFDYGDLYALLSPDKKIKWPDCEPSVVSATLATLTIGHPSGASGAFTFKNMLHGIDRTPGGCSVPNPDRPLKVDLSHHLMVYKVASLVSKQIGGPGLPLRTWSFQYQPSWSWNPSGYLDDCSASALSCDSTTTTEVTAPDGSITRSVFGNDYYRSVGQLLRVEVLGSGGVLLQQTRYSYLPTSIGQAFPSRIGWDPYLRNNPFETEQWHPAVSTVIVRDGMSFTSQVELCGAPAHCFDHQARPTRTRSFSTAYSKTQTLQYHDDATHWVLGQIRRVTNDDIGRIVSETVYNAQALPERTLNFGKPQEVLIYWPDGTLRSVADGRGNVTEFANYHRGIARQITHADGATESAVVNDAGWVTAVADENGYATGYGYDAMGRLASIVYPTQDSVAWSSSFRHFQALQPGDARPAGIHDGQWRLVETTGAAVSVTYYDALWQPVLEDRYDLNDPDGTRSQTVKRYDNRSRLSFMSYPQRGIGDAAAVTQGMRTFYDPLDRIVRVEQDSEHGVLATTSEYLPGLQIRTTDARGSQATTAYMAWDGPNYDLPILSQQPEGKVVQIDRHPQFGWPLALTQRNAAGTLSQTRRYVYDAHAQLCKTIEPETGATLMSYDGAGNLAWSAAGLNLPSASACDAADPSVAARKVLRSYDARNRLSTLAFPDGRGDQVWTYTPDGLPSTITTFNGPGNTIPVVNAYAYNARRLLAGQGESITQPGWYAWGIGYGYDALGHLAAHTYPTGLVVDYAPNALGQATKAGVFASGAQYHPNGALKQFTYGNGLVHTMEQNARQLPLRVRSGTQTVGYEYWYDFNGNPTQIHDLVRGTPYSRLLQYDGLDRLTDAGSASFGGNHWHHLRYDALDNITSWTLAGVKDYAEYVYDAQNRLSNIRNSAGATVVGLSYDAQGNLSNKNGRLHSFDYGNRLREVIGHEYYRYDGHGRRVMTGRPADFTLYQYSQAGQMLFEQPSAGANKAHVYLAGSLVATHTSDGTTVYSHTDALGSPVAVTNQAGQVIERHDYEPYGAIIGKPAYSGIGYTGHVMDGGTGLTYMQQRYYDQSLGRFLSVDPVMANGHSGINFNRYRYALNSPLRFTDPDGRCESISTCQMLRDDLDLINGKMTRDQYEDRQEARGAGVAAGIVVLGTVYTGGRLVLAAPPAAKFLAKRAAHREAIRQARAQAARGIRTLERRIAEHQKKIDEFKENPTIRPGMEGLSDDVIKAQHASRIRHLEREINAFKSNIEKLKEILNK